MTHSKLADRISVADQEFLDDASELLALCGSSAEQFQRYVREHLVWCEANGVEPPLEPDQRARYRSHLEEHRIISTERQWRLRATYLNKLPAVVAELQVRQQLDARRQRTRLIDRLPVGSPLAAAIESILDEVSPGYRRSLRSDLALVLEWCDRYGTDPMSIGSGELVRLRLWLGKEGRRSQGPLVAARRLHRKFYQPIQWWRPLPS